MLEIFSDRYGLRNYPMTHDDPGDVSKRITSETKVPADILSEEQSLIAAAYDRQGGNVSAIERDLRDRGVDFSRKRISRILDELGLPRIRK